MFNEMSFIHFFEGEGISASFRTIPSYIHPSIYSGHLHGSNNLFLLLVLSHHSLLHLLTSFLVFQFVFFLLGFSLELYELLGFGFSKHNLPIVISYFLLLRRYSFFWQVCLIPHFSLSSSHQLHCFSQVTKFLEFFFRKQDVCSRQFSESPMYLLYA